MWVAGGCEPRAPAASVEWHSRQSRSIRDRVSIFGLFEPCGSWHVRQPPTMPASSADVLEHVRTPLLAVAGQARQLPLPRQLERALARRARAGCGRRRSEAAPVRGGGRTALLLIEEVCPAVAAWRTAPSASSRRSFGSFAFGVWTEWQVRQFTAPVAPWTPSRKEVCSVVTSWHVRQVSAPLAPWRPLIERLVAARLHVGLPVAVAAHARRVAGQLAGRAAVRVRRRTPSTARGSPPQLGASRCKGRSTDPRHPEDQENEAGEANGSFHHLSPLPVGALDAPAGRPAPRSMPGGGRPQ